MKPRNWYSMKMSALPRGKATAEILIFNEIGFFGIRAKDFIADLKALGNVDEVVLRINSPGGDVADGNAIFNALKRHKASVRVEIDGIALSMAAVVAMAADEIVIAENGVMMIHNPWTIAIGDEQEMAKTADILRKFKSGTVRIFTERTGKKPEEISALMDDETWFDAEEAVAAGFADRTGEAVEIEERASHFDLSAFKKTPAELLAACNRETQLRVAAAGTEAMIESIREAVRLEEDEMKLRHKVESTVDAGGGGGGADAAAVAAAQAASAASVRDAVAAAVAAERARVQDIRASFAPLMQHEGAQALRDACEADATCTVADANARMLKLLGNGAAPLGGDPSVRAGADAHDKFHAAAVNAIVARVPADKDGKRAEQLDPQNPLRGLSLVEIARASLKQIGVKTDGWDAYDVVEAAMSGRVPGVYGLLTTSDFPNILSGSVAKGVMQGYEEAPQTWRAWTNKGSLSDFKTMTRAGLSTISGLEIIPEGGDYKYVTLLDRGVSIRLGTYGGILSISRQAIINDDLNAFATNPRRMGLAASRVAGNLAYAVLNDNAAMADGVALFHATHVNLAASGAAPSVATIDAGRVAMSLQTDNGNVIDIRPRFILVPPGLEGTAQLLFASTFNLALSIPVPGSNYVAGVAQPISDPRLAGTAWYLVADPAIADTVEVAFLDGNEKPRILTQEAWKNDAMEMKVSIDVGAAARDYRGMYKNPGA